MIEFISSVLENIIWVMRYIISKNIKKYRKFQQEQHPIVTDIFGLSSKIFFERQNKVSIEEIYAYDVKVE